MVSSNKEVSYEHRPHVNIQFQSSKGDNYTMHVVTNSQGLREDSDIPFEKPANVKRIIGLGDSVVFGSSVDNDKTFLKEMERQFSKKGLTVETLNFGIGFSNPRMEYYYLKYKKADHYAPDIILLGFCLNDFDTNYTAFNPEVGMWYYPRVPRIHHDTLVVRLKGFLLLKSRVIRLLNDTRHMFIKPNTRPSQYEKQEVAYWIKQIKEYSERIHVKFIVIIFPYKEQLRYSLRTGDVHFELQKAITQICDDLKISYYDLTSDLIDYLKFHKVGVDDFFWDSAHPWNRGHFAIGELVTNWIKQNKWLG